MRIDVHGKPSQTKVTRGFAIGFAVLICSLFVIAAAALISIARDQNAQQVEHTEVDVSRSVKANLRLLGTAMKDYAFWNDAYQYAGQKIVDLDWAYERDNIGPSLQKLLCRWSLHPRAQAGHTLCSRKRRNQHHTCLAFHDR
jgi:sensor domain CHASE-containing protein